MFASRKKAKDAGLARFLGGLGSKSGTAMVEFGLVLPFFLALLFGIMEGGRVMFTQAVMSYATQSATRWSVVNPQASGQTLADYEQQIEDYAKSKLILISPNHVATAAKFGADVATIPPGVVRKLASHPLTDKGLDAFLADWAKTGQKILS